MKKALLLWGGWPGHKPEHWNDVLTGWLRGWGFDVDSRPDLDVLADAAALRRYDLILPAWTLGQLTTDQEAGFVAAVEAGVGLGGFHGMCGAFTNNLKYKWMTGGQLVAHPGDCDVTYRVDLTAEAHPITAGLAGFTMRKTEQYYMHVDPRVTVLATTTFENGSVNPAVWVQTWGQGRVFYISIGHQPSDFDVPEPREILRRGLLWAAR